MQATPDATLDELCATCSGPDSWATMGRIVQRLVLAQRVIDTHDNEISTLQSTPESGARAGWDGAKRRQGSKVHIAVDTLGHLLAVQVTPANDQDRAQVAELADAVQEETGETVTLAYVDQGYTDDLPRAAAAARGTDQAVVKLPEGEARVCPVATPLGGGAGRRVDESISATRT